MTFRARLALAYLALLTLALSVFGVGVYAWVDRTLHREVDDAVRNEGRTLAHSLVDYHAALGVASWLAQRNKDQQPGNYILVEGRNRGDQDFSVRFKTQPALVNVTLPAVPVDGKAHFVPANRNALSLPLVAYSEEFSAVEILTLSPSGMTSKKPPDDNPEPNQISGRFTVARSLDQVERQLRVLRISIIGGGLAMLATVTLIGLGVSGALLRPLGRMRATAQRIGDERDFARRMPVDNPRDELGRLSTSFNQMLAELEQSHGDLQSTLEAQRRFVADASHELRTPMTAIRTNVEFLARVPNAREQDRTEALHDVLAEMRRMEALVGDLLALARLEAAARPARRSIRLDHLLTDIHRDAVRLAPGGVEVLLGPIPEVWVSGDRDDLRRAVWNLVENALKYTRQGRVELRLRSAQGLARLEVRDTGIGIAEIDHERVFDRFWRAPTTRGMAGSGLGLAITKWVAQAHDGNVTVSSYVGHGSTFVLQLPAIAARRARHEPDAPVGSALSAMTPP